MKVKNEYVKVKSGNKQHVFKNYIYDSYLKLFSDNQKEVYSQIAIVEDVYTDLIGCVIKVDTPLEDYKNATISDFDFEIVRKDVNVTGNSKKVSTVYNYNSSIGVHTVGGYKGINLEDYDGKNITAIGFYGRKSFLSITDHILYACVDTSFHTIKINHSEGIDITREDIVSSNAECDGIEYPLHLAPVLTRVYDTEDEYKGLLAKVRAVLYSVGFGTIKGEMQEEFVIGKDAEIATINDTMYGVVMKNPISTGIFPKDDLFPGDSLYPIQPEYKSTVYPQEKNVFPSDRLYPLQSGYNYIIFKYRLYYNALHNIKYLDEYYTMSYAHNPKGIFTITNRIERG